MQILFLVQYPSEVPYQVTFIKEGKELLAYCKCLAGESGQCCQHRINILEGSQNNIVSDNLDDVAIIQSWLAGTLLESALHDLKKSKALGAGAEDDVSAAKSRLAEIMHDTWTV